MDAQQLPRIIEGQYLCGTRWHRIVLRVTEKSNGDVDGEADLGSRLYSMNRRVLPGTPARLRGRVNGQPRVFRFSTTDAIQLVHGGPTQKTTFQAAIDEQGVLAGAVEYPGCSSVFAAGAGSPASVTVRGLVRQAENQEQTRRAAAAADQVQLDREERRVARRATGWVPAELRPGGGPLSAGDGMLEYTDARVAGRPTPSGIRPIDEVHQALFDGGHKCLSTSRVAWDGRTGTARTELFSRKTYVIDCDGNCQGIRYEPVGGLLGAFHGGAQAAPFLTLVHRMLGKVPVEWRFIRPDETEPPPEVRIHMWTSTVGDYGGGCRLR